MPVLSALYHEACKHGKLPRRPTRMSVNVHRICGDICTGESRLPASPSLGRKKEDGVCMSDAMEGGLAVDLAALEVPPEAK